MAELIHRDLSFLITGILFEVHNELGKYTTEKQVCDLIEERLGKAHIPYQRESVLVPIHAGEMIGRHRVDFLIDNKLVLEVKCKYYLTREDYFQIRRYLSVLNMKLGILVNFHEDRLRPKRVLNSTGKE